MGSSRLGMFGIVFGGISVLLFLLSVPGAYYEGSHLNYLAVTGFWMTSVATSVIFLVLAIVRKNRQYVILSLINALPTVLHFSLFVRG